MPAFTGATGLRLALDPRAFGDTAGRAGAKALALVTTPDDALLPDFATGDQIVVRLDPQWRGDGIYLLQLTPTSPAQLRRVRQANGAFCIDDANADDAATSFAAFADDEAGSLDGSPILRGTPLCIVRAVHTPHG